MEEILDIIGSIDNLGDAYTVSQAIENKIYHLQAKELRPIDGKGNLYTIDEFTDMVYSGLFKHYDGVGYYATDKEESGLSYKFNDISPDTFGKKFGFTHVVWYNR